MFITDQWKDLLLTENFFELGNFWQLALTALLLLATSKTLKVKSDKEIAQSSNPVFWFKHNRSFLVFWIVIVFAFGICVPVLATWLISPPQMLCSKCAETKAAANVFDGSMPRSKR